MNEKLFNKDFEYRRTRILKNYGKMKQLAGYYISRNDWEHALQTIFVASGYMYTLNQMQYDEELENMVILIANSILDEVSILNYSYSDETVIYYDSFGSVDRGLTKIYLKALQDLGYKVKYISPIQNEKILEITESLGVCEILCIEGNTYQERMISLKEIVMKSEAKYAFLYMTPDDLVATAVFSLFKGGLLRLLINLTDHSFWVGRVACDIIINFREFGAKVCRDYRGVPDEQIAYIPFYPCVVENKYQGLEFSNNSNKLIFSGGALYKTESRDNQYYRLVEDILNNYPDTNFLYLGTGDTRKIKGLVKKFPGRACFSNERSDFYEIMKQCTMYLSTYPYNGGLMTQYALLAQKVPVTLVAPGMERELSVQDEQSFWNFDSYDQCMKEIDRLLRNPDYRKEKEGQLKQFLIGHKEFSEELKHLLDCGKSIRTISTKRYEFDGFVRYPLEYYEGIKYYRLFLRKNSLFMFKKFPAQCFWGVIGLLIEKKYKK